MSKNKELITYKHLLRLLTSQSYFVWNSHKINLETSIIENEETDDFSIWELDVEDVPLEYADVMKSAYTDINYYFEKQIREEAKKLNKNVLIINEKNNQIAFNKTLEALKDNNVDWIINPVFLTEELIAKPILFRKQINQVSSLIHSTKSKLKYYVQAYFEINVIKKVASQNKDLNLDIKSYSFFTYDNKSTYTNVPDLKFLESEFCYTSKNGPKKPPKKSIEELEVNTIIEKINSGIINKKNNNVVAFNRDFAWYIEQINEARNITTHSQISWSDYTPWGSNQAFLDMYPFEKLNIPKMSGCILNKKDLLEILEQPELLIEKSKKRKSLKLLLDNQDSIDFVNVEKSIEKIKGKKCVWFDFEGFSLPFVFFKYTKPYQQLIFQVSVIKSNNDEIVKKNNIVLDPQKLNVNDFKNIVDAIYDQNYDWYIVYNKSYEHSKLNEMKKNIFRYELNDKEYQIYSSKINEIISKTYDLLDLFKVTNSNENIPLIFLKDLYGFSSIKKIEDLITKSKLNLPVMIKSYKSLNVQNGLMAMNKGIQRYLNTIGDNEWKEISLYLAEYCENDVMAMLMVYHFVLYIINNQK